MKALLFVVRLPFFIVPFRSPSLFYLFTAGVEVV
jgi:hypothetical protein